MRNKNCLVNKILEQRDKKSFERFIHLHFDLSELFEEFMFPQKMIFSYKDILLEIVRFQRTSNLTNIKNF